jgi:cytosine/adenosine deaminase-related metal-dependent hydrolase
MTPLNLLVFVISQAPTQSGAAITNVNVVDVERERIAADQTVIVRGNRIAALGPARSTVVPPGVRTIDGRGKYLIPGLWDMHVHAATPWFGDYFMPLLVANGVTAVRDMFTTAANVAEWRRRVGTGEWAGPRVAAFGQLVDGDPPIWPGSVVAKSADDGRRVVDSMKAAGADFVKVYSRLLPETFFAIAARSRELGIPFAGHVPSLVKPIDAAKAGMRTVEHLQQALQGCSAQEDDRIAEYRSAVESPGRWDSAGRVSRGQVGPLVESVDRARCERLAEAFVAAGTWMVPTFTVLRSIAYLDDSTLAKDPRLAVIPQFLKGGWNPSADFRFRMLTPADWARRKQVYARQLEIAGLFHRKGVRFLAGTDLANPYIYPGLSLHDELALMVSVGFTPAAALKAATTEPARFLGADSLGVVATGKVADLLLLEANPLESIENVGRITVVIAEGRVYDAEARRRIREESERRAAQAPRGN